MPPPKGASKTSKKPKRKSRPYKSTQEFQARRQIRLQKWKESRGLQADGKKTKTKSINCTSDVIDLTFKKQILSSNDSVKAATIIDSVADDTYYSVNTFNSTAEIAITSDSLEKEFCNSVNNDGIVDLSESIELVRVEPASVYDLVSDDSFCFNWPIANPKIPDQTRLNPKPLSDTSGIKRMVLIDGNSVAFSHSHFGEFSVKGIDICINHFLEKGYDTKAICPEMIENIKTSDQDLLVKLKSEGKIVSSPCKILPNGTRVISHVSRFILDCAVDLDAAVISNDNYLDPSINSDKYRDIINTRVIGFTFLNDNIRFPQDPYGKFGPSLDDILNG